MIYGYCRVSTDKQSEEGESLGVQQRQLEGWCAMHNHTLDQMFVEAGVSGGKQLEQRPKGAELLKRCQRGDTVIATRLDRLFRSSRDALNLVHELRAKGIRLHVLDMGEITAEGLPEAMLTCAAAFATLERHHIKERIRTVKQDQKSRGRYLGGKRPFGFCVGPDGALQAHVFEQQIVAELRELSRTMSIRKVQRAVVERYGVSLSHMTVARLTAPERV